MKGLIDHFVAVNRTRIAVFYQADAYGRAGWGGLREALDEHGLEIAGEATYRRGSPFDQSYDRQVAIMQSLQPDAVVCVGTYPACAGFVRDMRDRAALLDPSDQQTSTMQIQPSVSVHKSLRGWVRVSAPTPSLGGSLKPWTVNNVHGQHT